MKIIENLQTLSKCYDLEHKSGLKILFVPTPGKTQKTAMIATKFGSINITANDSDKKIDIPDGTAHFLEHKLFEGKNGNAFDYYAKTGAKANAYTSNDKTAYYFVCTDKFEQNLQILLSFITNPYLTEQNVEKEKGIIAQEISMYDDEPSWQGYFGLLQCLYKTHAVRRDIAGTVEEIRALNVDTLMACYNTYYNLSNMVLCVAGDIEIDSILSVCDKVFKTSGKSNINRYTIVEQQGVNAQQKIKKMPVSTSLFNIGFKDNDTNLYGLDIAKKEIEVSILLQILFGKASKFYTRLYKSALINQEFVYGYEMSQTYGFALLSGESADAKKVYDEALCEIQNCLKNGIDNKQFISVRNSLYGSLVSIFDNVSGIVNRMVATTFSGYNIFDSLNILKDITVESVMDRAKQIFDPCHCAISIIEPWEADA